MIPWPLGPRRALLVLHVATSVGLMGAVGAFLLLALVAVAGGDTTLGQSAYPAMDLLARLLILPLALGALLVGVLQGFVTNWGVLSHWWVVAKLVLSLLVLGVLLLQLGGIRVAAEAAGDAARLDDLGGLRWSFVIHAAGGLTVLILALVLSVVEPRGRTPWTRRPRSSHMTLPQ